eukprot:COSAG01_NODE_1155_length_11480_cov_35.572445_5_plen_217_part_00
MSAHEPGRSEPISDPRFRIPNPDWWPSAGPKDNYPSPGMLDFIEETTNTLNTLLTTVSQSESESTHSVSDWQLIQNQLKRLQHVKYVPTDKNLGWAAIDTDEYRTRCMARLHATHTEVTHADFTNGVANATAAAHNIQNYNSAAFKANYLAGTAAERQLLPLLSSFFASNLRRSEHPLSPADFVCKDSHTLVELKSRSITSATHPTPLTGAVLSSQ